MRRRTDRPSTPSAVRAGDRSGEGGSATVYVLSMVLLLVTLTLGAAGFAGLATAKHRAAAAADLAALAAASAAADGCGLAATTAARNGARLTACTRQGREVAVTVVVVAAAPLGFRPAVRARARAGPAP